MHLLEQIARSGVFWIWFPVPEEERAEEEERPW
nr:putative protease [Nonomuraea sp.]